MKSYLGFRIPACITIVLLVTSSAWAAEWRPISLMVGEQPYKTFHSFVFRSSNFLDGAYTPVGSFMLSNSPNLSMPTYVGEQRTEISFSSYFGSPPVVNLGQQTIDVSSMWAVAYQADWGCAISPTTCDYRYDKLVWGGLIGWTFGPDAVVPYEVNGDGTYTATWNAVDSQNGFNGFGNDTVRFTFATAVPEPSIAMTFAVGLTMLGACLRAKQEHPPSSRVSP